MLHSIEDYYKEVERVKALIQTTKSNRARRNWYKYLTRLLKEIQTYNYYKGVENDKPHRIFDNRSM